MNELALAKALSNIEFRAVKSRSHDPRLRNISYQFSAI